MRCYSHGPDFHQLAFIYQAGDLDRSTRGAAGPAGGAKDLAVAFLQLTQHYASDRERFREDIRLHYDVQQEVIAAGRAELLRIHRAGIIEDEEHEVEHDLDVEELAIILRRGD